jgi:hypothetical protein
MKKTVILGVFFMIFVLVVTHGQEKNTVFLNFSPATLSNAPPPYKIGIGYERAINDSISCLFTIDYAKIGHVLGADVDERLEIAALAHFRYYPLKNSFLSKLFFDIGAGYTFFRWTARDSNNETISNLFPIQTMIGWRFNIKKVFLQPWVGYNIPFGVIEEDFKYGYPNFGLAIGFKF